MIGQDALGSGSSIFIDKGKNRGIKEDMAVIVSNGILVGKVSEVFPDTAKILLITDQESAVNGEVLESGAKGIVRGTYGLGIMMDMISQAEVVKEGDTAITSGLRGRYAKRLIFRKDRTGQAVRRQAFSTSHNLPVGGFFFSQSCFCSKKFLNQNQGMKKFHLFLIILTLFIFQYSILGVFFRSGRIPNLFVALVTSLAIIFGFEKSLKWIFFAGFLLDAGSAWLMGSGILALVVILWLIDKAKAIAEFRSKRYLFAFLLFLTAGRFKRCI